MKENACRSLIGRANTRELRGLMGQDRDFLMLDFWVAMAHRGAGTIWQSESLLFGGTLAADWGTKQIFSFFSCR